MSERGGKGKARARGRGRGRDSQNEQREGGDSSERRGVTAFNMEDEKDEGHFDDVGNFVWNAEDKKVQEEAWLDDVSEQQIGEAQHAKSRREFRDEQDSVDALTEEAATRVLATLLRPRETVLQALKRVGSKKGSRKKARNSGSKRKLEQRTDTNTTPTQSAEEKKQFEQITEAADFLMRGGEVDVYSQMKEEFIPEEELLAQRRPGDRVQFAEQVESEGKSEEHPPQVETMWEYKAMDGQIHGPFPTSSVVAWQQQGYFTGDTAVDMRQVGGDSDAKSEVNSESKTQDKPAVSAEQEMLDDFEDSDEEQPQTVVDKSWQRSDRIDFALYH